MATVFIPALLHQFTDNVSQIDVEGPNVRAIVNKARYNEHALVLWEKDHKAVTEKLVALLALLLEEPSNTRDVGVLDLLEIEHRTYPVTEILEMKENI